MMSLRYIALSALSVLLVATAGCGGWALRGTQSDITVESVFIDATRAPRLAAAVNVELAYSNVPRVARKNAAVIIELNNEEFDRRVLSVDPDTGKVREVELGLEVGFVMRGRDGKELTPPEKLNWVQDYVFDESSLLGTVERAQIIERELAEDAAQTILRRLETIDISGS